MGTDQNPQALTEDPNESMDSMSGAPQMGQEAPEQPQAQAPGQSVSFDVDQNPDDMQFMTDTMMYAPMLKSMDVAQRKEKWPGIAEKLGAVSPKAKAMLDPTLPPTDDDLDSLIGKMPQATKPQKEPTGEMTEAHLVPSDIKWGDMSNEEMLAMTDNVGMFDDNDDKDPRFEGVPKGSMWIDHTDKTKGYKSLKVETKKLTPEASAKIMMLKVAKSQIPIIKNHLFNEDGGVNWSNVKKSNIPIIGGSVPWDGPAKQLATAYEHGIQGITRGETGAAMPDSELGNTRERYQVNAWDTEDSALQKFIAYKLFINGTLKLTYETKDKSGKKVGKFDSAAADAYRDDLQMNILAHKKGWMQRAVKANPTATVEQLHKLFNKSVLNDPKFLKKMGKQLKEGK